MQELLAALRAAAEQTRLRILSALSQNELTVSELCRVLGQSQPRVSRHLKLLCDAEVLERHAEGNSAFYRPARTGIGRAVLDSVVSMVDAEDSVIGRDRSRLAAVRAERAELAAAYFEDVASDWDRVRSRHVEDEVVESALVAAVRSQAVGDFLDIGTGSGRILELLANRCERGLGIDLSRQMLNVARARLDEHELRNCSVRQGNIYNLELPAGSMDLVVIHHVLHFLDAPEDAVREAARVLRPNGQLLIVDFAPHEMEELRSEHAHRHLGFPNADIEAWTAAAGLNDLEAQDLTLADSSKQDHLTTTLWSLTQRSDAPDIRVLDTSERVHDYVGDLAG